MIWFTLLLLISAKADEACEKKIGKIAELACSKKHLDIGKAEIKLSEEAKGLEEKQRKANIEKMVRAYKKKIRSLKKPLNKNADFLLFLSLAEQEIKTGRSPSEFLYSRSSDDFLDGDKVALEACIRTKKGDINNIEDYDSCANFLAQVVTERAHGELFYDFDDDDDSYNPSQNLELEVKLRENSLYKKVYESERRRIISKHDEIYEKFDEAIKATLVDVKKTMKDFISKPGIIQSEEVRKKMQKQIERIKFEGSSCLSEGIDSVAPLFYDGAGYNVKEEILTYCRGEVDGQRISEYQLIQLISHELAHSIDPCFIQFDFKSNSAPIINYEGSDSPEKIYPFPIIECLRSEDSIQAFRPNYRPYPHHYYSMYYDTQNTPYNSHPPSRPSRPPPPFCHHDDQIGESFCDWLATEILFRHMNSNSKLSGNDKNQHINGIASIYRSHCYPKDGLGLSELGQDIGRHPASIDRLERITLAHPGIRRKLCGKNVKSKVRYCDPTIKPTNRSGDKSSSSIK